MTTLNPQAEELNNTIKQSHPAVYNLLSERGRGIFFPKKGILAQTAEAKGKKINATIGTGLEDNGTPMRLESISSNINLDPKDVFPYAPSFGKLELRQTWKKMIFEKNPSLKTETSLPVVTNALTHALNQTAYLFANPNDKIIVSDTFWGNYRLTYEIGFGAQISTYNTYKNEQFDIESFQKKLKDNPGKQIILLNFPNNPTGYTPSSEEAHKIAESIIESANRGNEIAVILDDAYFGLVYEDGIYKESIFTLLTNSHKNILAIKVDGATKEDYVWGFRVGFITYGCKDMTAEVYEALENKTAGSIRGTISNVSHLSQSLVLKAFTSSSYKDEKKEKYELLKSRYKKVRTILKNPKYSEYFTPLPFNSGYFMCVQLKEGLEAEKIRKILLEKYDTGLIAIGNLLRIAFSSAPEDCLEELFENIYNACRE